MMDGEMPLVTHKCIARWRARARSSVPRRRLKNVQADTPVWRRTIFFIRLISLRQFMDSDDFDYGVFSFVFFCFALACFNFDLAWVVSWYESSVSAAIDMVFLTEVVPVEQSLADALNADENSAWISFLSLCRFQCCIASTVFQLGSLPGTRITIGFEEVIACAWEKFLQVHVGHASFPPCR
jgi:hypothetical protein